AVRVPAAVDLGVHLLAEQAGDVLAGRRQATVHQSVVEGRGNHQLDDRLPGPTRIVRTRPGVEVGLFEVLQRGADQDPALVVRLQLGTRCRGEVGQFGQRHVHAEGAGGAAVAVDALGDVVV